ncbi:MAG TPA: hypothetical protein VF719_06015, partial [Abditibacteriaceae bacterium]
FMFELRCGSGWDKQAHARLFQAMVECCKAHEGETHVERWIAAGFDWLDDYPRNNMPSDDDYYENAVTNFNHLTWWLFQGEGRADDEFEPI